MVLCTKSNKREQKRCSLSSCIILNLSTFSVAFGFGEGVRAVIIHGLDRSVIGRNVAFEDVHNFVRNKRSELRVKRAAR